LDNNATIGDLMKMKEYATWTKNSDGATWTTCKFQEFALQEEPTPGY
jgi:hypothetical protein